MKVKNGKCISKIAFRLLLSNRRRNIITVSAIILTAVLFTSLFTIMLSVNASYELSMFRQLGGYVHGTFKDVTPAQEEKLIRHRNIKEYGERMLLGVIDDETFKKLSAEVSFMDDNTAKWSFVELEEGHMPAEKNEVVMDKEALRLLGHEPVLGESIELTFNIKGDTDESSKYTDTFILSGYWEFDTLCPAHYINVSREYAKDFSDKIIKMGYEPLSTDLDVMLSSSFNALNKMTAAVEESGYTCGEESTDSSIRMGVNPGYTTIAVDGDEMTETAALLGMFLLLVILTGYLIIYNVFQISVAGDIRFYGLLKTIGTTQKQIRRIVRLQALALCIVGIPAGLLLGYLLGTVLTPAVIETTTMSGNSLSISSSPLIFVASAFFEMITVLISVSSPGRMAGKVSPIEALRFNEGTVGRKKRKATRGARTWQMAFANMDRNKKKTILVFTSLALSLVVLNAVNMFVGGLDSEKWLSKTMSADFIVAKYPYFKYQGAGPDSITEEEIAMIKENTDARNGGVAYDVAGVPLIQVSEEEFREFYNTWPGEIPVGEESGKRYLECFIEGMDDYLIDKLDVYEGDLSLLKDRDKRYIALITHRAENGEYFIGENAPKIGDKITIAQADHIEYDDPGNGEPANDPAYDGAVPLSGTYAGIKEYEYTVCAYVGVSEDISLRESSLSYNAVVCSDNLKEDLGENVRPVFYAFEAGSSDAEEKAESFLHGFCEEIPDIIYESKASRRREFDGLKRMFAVLGGALCLIIGFVGILNYLNTVMAGIITRKNEIAVLEAIGMTGKQVKEMLIIEGLIYTAGSGMLALLLSLIFSPAVNGIANNIFWFYSKHFSVTPVLAIMPVMVLLGVLVPLMSYRGLSVASIVERIREIG